MQVWTVVCGHVADYGGQAFSPTQTRKNTSFTPRFFMSSSPTSRTWRLPRRSRPTAEDVFAAVQRDTDRGVDRPVSDLAIADLDHDGVDEHRDVISSSGRFCHDCISSTILSVIRLTVSLLTTRCKSPRNAR